MAHFFSQEYMRQNNEALWALIEPVVNGMGYDLVEIEYDSHPRNSVLRVYIDQENGITLDNCGDVSLQLSALFDVEDPIRGHYNLEVSSPGLDRPLRKANDFERFSGNTVKIKMAIPVGDRRNFKGKLLGLKNDRVTIDVDGEVFELPVDAIDKARLVPEF